MTTALSGRHLGSRQPMPTELQKSGRCGGSLGLELNEPASINTWDIGAHVHCQPGFFGSPVFQFKQSLYNPMRTRSFIRAQMSPNTQNPSICANGFPSFSLPLSTYECSIFTCHDHRHVTLPKATWYTQRSELDERVRSLNNQLQPCNFCVHLDNLSVYFKDLDGCISN